MNINHTYTNFFPELIIHECTNIVQSTISYVNSIEKYKVVLDKVLQSPNANLKLNYIFFYYIQYIIFNIKYK